MKKILSSIILFFVVTLVTIFSIYQLSFSEQANIKSHTNKVLGQNIEDIVFSFENYELISSEINELHHSSVNHKFMFKLTFKTKNSIKYAHIHDANIKQLVNRLNKSNFRTQQNIKTFQSNFSLFFSHFTIQSEKEYTDFMNEVFVKSGLLKR